MKKFVWFDYSRKIICQEFFSKFFLKNKPNISLGHESGVGKLVDGLTKRVNKEIKTCSQHNFFKILKIKLLPTVLLFLICNFFKNKNKTKKTLNLKQKIYYQTCPHQHNYLI